MRINRTSRAILIAAAAVFSVQVAQPQSTPGITVLNPTSANTGDPAFSLAILGYGFVSGTTVTWNSIPLPTQFIGNTLLNATVPASLVASPGTALLVVVNPNGGRSNTALFTVQRVAPTIGAPTLSITTASPLPPARVEEAYSQAFAATGGTEPYRWAATGGIPSGLILNPSTGVLSGASQVKGSFTFTVQAVDKGNSAVTKDFSLTVKPPALAITTEPPLFSGTVGSSYSQPFTASGGTPPYRWSLLSGQIGGLTLDPNTGNLTGTPSTTGSFSLVVQIADSAGERASKSYVLLVNPRTISITTASTLPKGTVGMPYSQALAVNSGTPPFTWAITAGWIPGLKLDPATGILGQTPTEAGPFSFVVEVRDSAGLTATKSFTIIIGPAVLAITADLDLPGGRIGDPYSQTLAASGGLPPYSWSTTGLPEGLSIDAATGNINGIPMAPGSFSFNARVTDSARTTVIALFRIKLDLPSLPSITISGPPATSPPAQQNKIKIELDAPYPVPLTGQVLLSFAPDAGGSDGTIQFSTGGRAAAFQIPAGSITAAFDVSGLAFQCGTVAGNIQLTLQLLSGGVDITPKPAPAVSVRIERAAPVINGVKFIRKANGFDVQVTGFSTSRELTEAVFRFAATSGNTLQQGEIRIPVESAVGAWFQDQSSFRFGSQFTFTQSFAVQGDPLAVNPVSVILTNRLGSTTATINP